MEKENCVKAVVTKLAMKHYSMLVMVLLWWKNIVVYAPQQSVLAQVRQSSKWIYAYIKKKYQR